MIAAAASPPDQPFQASPSVIDHGQTKSGTLLHNRFHVMNRGSDKITVNQIEVSCGCLQPTISKKVLLPNEEATVELDVNTLAQPIGPNTWRLELFASSQTTNYKLELFIKSTIVRELEINPIALSMITNGAMSRELTISYSGKDPFELKRIQTSASYITTQLSPEKAIQGAKQVRTLAIRVTEACPPGHHQEFIELFTNSPSYPMVRIPLTITRRMPETVEVFPEHLSLFLARNQHTASGLIQLRSPNDNTILIDRIRADHPDLTTKWVVGPGKRVTLRIMVTPTQPPPQNQAYVRVYLKESKSDPIVIPVSWHLP